ncbi:MAG: hypothetical protein ISR75_06930 [Phycisphaerales bacterium]|nr:hypothetical protein [Phycisphaerales bacterium]
MFFIRAFQDRDTSQVRLGKPAHIEEVIAHQISCVACIVSPLQERHPYQ